MPHDKRRNMKPRHIWHETIGNHTFRMFPNEIMYWQLYESNWIARGLSQQFELDNSTVNAYIGAFERQQSFSRGFSMSPCYQLVVEWTVSCGFWRKRNSLIEINGKCWKWCSWYEKIIQIFALWTRTHKNQHKNFTFMKCNYIQYQCMSFIWMKCDQCI